MNDLEQLLAIERIRTVKARYWRLIDTKQWDPFLELFTPEATMTAHGAGFRCESREEIGRLLPPVLDGVVTAHHGHQSEIEIEADDRATAIFAMADYLFYPPEPGAGSGGTASVRGFGHYVDRFVRRDGHWLIDAVDLYRLRHEVTSHSRTAFPPELLN